MSSFAIACRDCSRGLLRTARQWKNAGRPDEVSRLVRNARFYWHRYLLETMEN